MCGTTGTATQLSTATRRGMASGVCRCAAAAADAGPRGASCAAQTVVVPAGLFRRARNGTLAGRAERGRRKFCDFTPGSRENLQKSGPPAPATTADAACSCFRVPAAFQGLERPCLPLAMPPTRARKRKEDDRSPQKVDVDPKQAGS